MMLIVGCASHGAGGSAAEYYTMCAFATSGLALGARLEMECLAH